MKDFYVSEGMKESVPLFLLEQIKTQLLSALKEHSDYQVVLAGHSLAGVKAIFTAMYLHGEVPVSAVYTYGHMPFGSHIFTDNVVECLGPDRVVRVVSGGDLAPWSNAGSEIGHSELVKEVFSPSGTVGEWVVCQGALDEACSYGVPCEDKSFADHGTFGGLAMGDIKLLLK